MSATKERGTRRDYWKRLLAGAEGKDRSEERRAKELPTDWDTGLDVYHWWMEDGALPGQLEFEGGTL